MRTRQSIDPGRVGVFISTWNRSDYTQKSLETLARALPPPATRILVVDDASTNFGVGAIEALDALRAVHPALRVFKNPKNLGITEVIRQFMTLAGIFGVDYLYITDNDILYGRGWFHELLACYEHFARHHTRAVVSCLNVPKHTMREGPATNDFFVEKETIGGASWMASLETMRELLIPDVKVYWDDRCLERLRAQGGIVGCTRRSYVQHIGDYGLNSRGNPDRGDGFVGEE